MERTLYYLRESGPRAWMCRKYLTNKGECRPGRALAAESFGSPKLRTD